MDKKSIQRLLNCEITWNELSKRENCKSYLIESGDDIINVDSGAVIAAINSCLNNKYTKQDLLDWANVVRFSDVF